MSNVGQGILTIGGAIVGSFFGYPQLGFMVGSLLGQTFFPTQLPTVRGPQLDDLAVQGSSLGVPIPIVYGTYRVAGNIIWSTDLIPTTTTEEVGGKGGPTQRVETTTYAVTFAVGLCNSEITGIRRIWAGGKLIYDRRVQQSGESNEEYAARQAAAAAMDSQATLYLGTEEQLPDPTIESYEGLGNVPAFRGLAYIVIRDFQLADYGNNLSGTALSFEIVSGGEILFNDVYTVSPRVVYPWVSNVNAPYNPRNDHSVDAFFAINDDSIGQPGNIEQLNLSSPQNAIAAILADTSTSPGGQLIAPTHWPAVVQVSAFASRDLSGFGGNEVSPPNLSEWGRTSATMSVPVPAQNIHSTTQYYLPQGASGPSDYLVYYSAEDGTLADFLTALGRPAGTVVYVEGDVAPSLYRKFSSSIGGVATAIWNPYGLADNATFGRGISDGSGLWYACASIMVQAVRVPRAPDNPCNPQGLSPYPLSEQYPGFCVIDGVFIEDADLWNEVTGQNNKVNSKMLQRYNRWTAGSPQSIYRDQVGPLLVDEDPNYNNQAYWEALYNQAVIDGLMPAGLVYSAATGGGSDTSYPMYPTDERYYDMTNTQSTISPNSISLQQVVEDICRRCNLDDTQVNAADLVTIPVDGYAIGRVSDGADAIQPLRPYGLFDAVESNARLKFLRRGGAVVATIPVDDLCAHEANSDRPTAVEVTRIQDIELPRMVRLRYSMFDKDYEVGQQPASRLRTTANQIIDLVLPLATSDLKAAQLADINLYEAWLNRNTYKFALSQKYLPLEPTDAVNIVIDGELQRVRIVSEDFSIPGIKQIEAVRDGGRDAYYTSYVTPGVPLSPEQGVVVLDDTVGFFLDLPILRDADDNPGYYIGMRQENNFGAWPSAAALRSLDGGGSYSAVATATRQVVSGVIVGVFDVQSEGNPSVIDYTVTLTVTLDRASDTLSSTTLAALLTGANAAAVGADGRWEIIQFLTATLTPGSDGNSWELSGLLRGRRGTEHAIGLSEIGDRFIMLNNLVRATQELTGVGVERLLRTITSGQALDAQAPVPFTGNGEGLRPFSPVHVSGYRDGSGDVLISWIRRSRFGQELTSGTDVPLGEETEAYDIEVYDGSVVTREVTVNVQNWTYTEADQITDFGSAQAAVTIRIYQISATVGRGRPAEAVV